MIPEPFFVFTKTRKIALRVIEHHPKVLPYAVFGLNHHLPAGTARGDGLYEKMPANVPFTSAQSY